MSNVEVLKKVKENFKKKRKHWQFVVGTFSYFGDDGAYCVAERLLGFLSESFSAEDKEKFSFNKLSVGVKNVEGSYVVSVAFG